MSKNVRTIIVISVILLSIIVLTRFNMLHKHPNSLTVWTRFQPYSVDPLDYDYDVHHLVMRSVLASLVTVYKSGEIVPQVAKNWNSTSNNSKWELEIDNSWLFSNGEHVTADIVLSSFKRVILIKNAEKSKSGLLEYIKGFDNFTSLNQDLDGLYIINNKIVFDFTKPMPDFLDKISFGLYAISHPEDYDIHGKWKNKKKGITSGIYKIKEWKDDSITITKNIKTTNDSTYKDIIFHYSKDLEAIRASDIIFYDIKNPYIVSDEWTYVSKSQNNSILYVQVMNWDDPKNYFHSIEARRNARDQYYTYLKKVGYKTTKSFFPLDITGIKEFEISNHSNISLDADKIRTQHFIYNEEFYKQGVIERGKYFKEAFEQMSKDNGFKLIYNDYPENRIDEKKVFDVQFLGTSILISQPRDDIQFMFKSKQGINLPDQYHKIFEILENENFNIQEVNEELWNQAIIWPITHSSNGMWIKKSSHINVNELNTSLLPLDAQFIYWQ